MYVGLKLMLVIYLVRENQETFPSIAQSGKVQTMGTENPSQNIGFAISCVTMGKPLTPSVSESSF